MKIIIFVFALLSSSVFARTLEELTENQVGGTLVKKDARHESIRYLCYDKPVDGKCNEGRFAIVYCSDYSDKKCRGYAVKDLMRYATTSDKGPKIPTNFKNILGHTFFPMGIIMSLYLTLFGVPSAPGKIVTTMIALPLGLGFDLVSYPFKGIFNMGTAVVSRIRLRQFFRSIRRNKGNFEKRVGKKTFKFLQALLNYNYITI